MKLVEALKNAFFKIPREKEALNIPLNHPKIEADLTPDNYAYNVTQGFFDDDPFYVGSDNTRINAMQTQDNLIREYRRTSMLPEVATAIDEIVNEAAFVADNDNAVYLDFSDKLEMNEKLKNAITDSFDEVLDVMDFNYNVDNLIRRFYIDGQLITALTYNTKKMKNGIQRVSVMTPFSFGFDNKINMYRYFNTDTFGSQNDIEKLKKESFSEEEIVKIDSGIYDTPLILSNLHTAIKIANQLQTIEDLVVPFRFSRSIARRVFNVDVGNLPPAKIRQEMDSIKREYKYKKYYDVEKGTMSNSTTVSSIVEDYWFPNRNGAKGTTVDVLNETGGASFSDMGDAEYFRNKLYEALKVPLGRISGGSKATSFDFTATASENDEQRFFAFINRLRQRFNVFLIELLRRQLGAKGIMNNLEFDKYKNFISIKWEKENNFLEREKLELLKQRLELYSAFKEYEGDIFSRNYLLKNILKMSDEEISQMKQEIRDELKGKVDNEEEADSTFPNGTRDDDTEDDESKEEPEKEEKTDSEEADEKPEEEKEDKEFGTNFKAEEK
jgi:hypothetical protein